MDKWQAVACVIGGAIGIGLGLIITFDTSINLSAIGFAIFQVVANNTPQIILEENYKKT